MRLSEALKGVSLRERERERERRWLRDEGLRVRFRKMKYEMKEEYLYYFYLIAF